MLEVPPKPIDALDQSLQQAAAEHEGAAVANEGKRYAFNRHQADGHGDVDEHVHGEEHRDAEREQGAEAVAGEPGDPQSVPQHHAKQSDDGDASQKSLLLGDDRENKVVVRDGARQVAELGLGALGPALAGEAAGADGDERLAAVPADAHGVDLVRQGEIQHAVALVVLERQPGVFLVGATVTAVAQLVLLHELGVVPDVEGDDADEQGEHAQGPGKEPHREVGNVKHGEDHRRNHEGAAKVGFGHYQQHGYAHRKGQFYEHLERVLDRAETRAGEDGGGGEKHGDLGEFRGLEGAQTGDIKPALGAHAVGRADTGDQDQQQQGEGEQVDKVGVFEPQPVIQQGGRDVDRRAHGQPDELVDPLLLVGGELGAVDEENAEKAQHNQGRGRDAVEPLAGGELEKTGEIEAAEKLHGKGRPATKHRGWSLATVQCGFGG